MKLFFTTLITFLSFTQVFSQDNWCGSDAKLNEAFEANPQLKQQIADQMARMHQSGFSVDDRSGDSITIPCVVHVIHDNGIGNISHEQILDGLRMLNEDFCRLNADSSNTRNNVNAPFQPIAANLKIRFELARRDPNGNCTNGVQRRNSAAGSYEGTNATSKSFAGGGLGAWNRNQYFNIWIVNTIESTGTGTTLGYAQFPYFGSANTYGIILRNDVFGSIGTGSGDRTLTHEVGHCFGLFHTFQDGCGSNGSDCTNQGDYCCDTPPVDEAHWSCSSTQNYCNQVPNNDFYGIDVFDQHENFMSYSPCQNMFSTGQKNIVYDNFNNYNFLASLHSANNLVNTGLSTPAILCQAEFSADKKVICSGETVEFSDNSYASITSRNWTFTGGSPATSADSTVSITYNTPGVFPVSINVTDGAANLTTTETDYIIVLPDPGVSLPIIEGFETLNSFPDNYNFFSTENISGDHWEISNNASNGSTKTAFFNNYSSTNSSSTVALLESGPIDLSVLDPVEDLVFSFDYAYSKRSSSNDEWLKILASNDCGETWSVRKTIHGNVLGSNIQNSAFVPVSEDEWEHVEITSINSSFFTSNFRYKFQFESDGGNNIYIDNINIYPESWLGLKENKNELNSISLYPNPVLDILNITFDNGADFTTIEIFNTVGKKIAVINAETISQDGIVEYSVADLASGVYYLKVSTNQTSVLKKFIKQ